MRRSCSARAAPIPLQIRIEYRRGKVGTSIAPFASKRNPDRLYGRESRVKAHEVSAQPGLRARHFVRAVYDLCVPLTTKVVSLPLLRLFGEL